ncbi:MAG: ABC transporter ATP-binding protein [Spirochaetota bacterium]
MSGFFEASLEHRVGHFHLELELSLNREIGVLFGPSGAGKSLTLRLLAGLTNPSRGRLQLGDRLLMQVPGRTLLPPRRRRIGLVHQDLSLFPHMTVLENVAYGVRGSKGKREAQDWIERMHLSGLEERYPEKLSGGQKQRVALARALAAGPELLLLDEPFSALDNPLKRGLRRELKRLQRETGIPVLYVTHHIEDVCALGRKIFLIRDGKLKGSFPVEHLWQAGSQAVAWSALGWGNLIRGEVLKKAGGTWLVWGEGALQLSPVVELTGPVSAFIPPQEVKLLYPDIPVDPQLAVNVMEARVVERYFVGNICTLYVFAAGLNWHLEFPISSYKNLDLHEGAGVQISVRPRVISLLETEAEANLKA